MQAASRSPLTFADVTDPSQHEENTRVLRLDLSREQHAHLDATLHPRHGGTRMPGPIRFGLGPWQESAGRGFALLRIRMGEGAPAMHVGTGYISFDGVPERSPAAADIVALKLGLAFESDMRAGAGQASKLAVIAPSVEAVNAGFADHVERIVPWPAARARVSDPVSLVSVDSPRSPMAPWDVPAAQAAPSGSSAAALAAPLPGLPPQGAAKASETSTMLWPKERGRGAPDVSR